MATEVYELERQVAQDVIAGVGVAVTGPVFFPDDDFDPPEPANDSSARYLEVDLDEDDSELDTMGPGERIDGRVVVSIWVEVGAGDALIRQIARQLRTAFRAGDVDGMQFLATRLGAGIQDGPEPRWYARELHIQYVLFR